MTHQNGTTSSIFASLTYDDAPAAIEFLCGAFGFTKRLVVPGEDGTVRHSELTHGNGVVMISSPRDNQERPGPEDVRRSTSVMSVCVADPDAHYATAKAAGAVIVREMQDEDYGSRGYMAQDPEGHHWYFGTYQPGAHWE